MSDRGLASCSVFVSRDEVELMLRHPLLDGQSCLESIVGAISFDDALTAAAATAGLPKRVCLQRLLEGPDGTAAAAVGAPGVARLPSEPEGAFNAANREYDPALFSSIRF